MQLFCLKKKNTVLHVERMYKISLAPSLIKFTKPNQNNFVLLRTNNRKTNMFHKIVLFIKSFNWKKVSFLCKIL